jgi:sugar lactone lactonase YvrE
MNTRQWIGCLCLLLAGCGSDESSKAASHDKPHTPRDAGRDSGADASADSGTDSGSDAGAQLARRIVLVGPPSIGGANGIRFDKKNKLYVGSVNDGTLYRIDPETGETLDTLGADLGVQTPDDLTIAPDGTLYVVNIYQGNVVSIRDGKSKVVASLGFGVDGIALAPNGKLIIGKDFLADGLYEVDPSGDTDPRTVNATPGWINAMAFAPDGTLYAPVWQKKYVARVDLEKGTLEQFSKEFAGTAGAVRFDSHGKMYAVDGGTGDVYRIDMATGKLTSLVRYGLPLDNLAFDSDDRLFVSSYGDGSVHEVLADGSLRVVRAGGLMSPSALAVSSDDGESVYIGDTNGVHEYDGVKAAHRGGFGNALALPAARIVPTALHVAGDHLLALGTASVETWDRATGDVASSIAVTGGNDVVEFHGHILVSQPSAGSVVQLAADKTTTFADELGDPAGLAADDKNVFVTIFSAGEVRQLARDGAKLDKPRVVATDLDAPEGIALLPNGDLAVIEAGSGDLVEVDPKTGDKTVLASELIPAAVDDDDAGAKLGALHAVGAGASGCVYVLSPGERSVYRVCAQKK